MSCRPFPLRPIDDVARDGHYRIIRGADQFAIARWINQGWAFSSGQAVPFEPDAYYCVADAESALA